jgi:hypothetical protein
MSAKNPIYRGVRDKERCVVTVHPEPGSVHELAVPGKYGVETFDWGREVNPSVAELAFALLLDSLLDPNDVTAAELRVLRLHWRFAIEILAGLPFNGPWHMWRAAIIDWAAAADVEVSPDWVAIHTRTPARGAAAAKPR